MAFRWRVSQRPCLPLASPLSSSRQTHSTTGQGIPRRASTKSFTNNLGASVTITPDITNYYTVFPKTVPAGPPPASPFVISTDELKREFLQLQSLVHPDKYSNVIEKKHAESLSARVNQAYHTLSDPLRRSQYILREWYGIDVTAEDAATKHALDPEILMEIIEVQETIELVGATSEGEAQVEILKRENAKKIAECVEFLGRAFEMNDIEAAKKECIRLRFWYSVGEGLREWEPGNTEIRLMHSTG